MNRVIAGLCTTLIVAALVGAGLWTIVDTYVVGANNGFLLESVATAVIAFGFVFVLFVLGARSDRWLRSPYW